MQKWCKTCKKAFLEDEVCPDCGDILHAEIPTMISWCHNCNIPIIREQNSKDIKCPLCDAETKYLCKDLRPVFPEERLLIEILLGKPFRWKEKSVWANGSRFYINGKTHTISTAKYRNANVNDPSPHRKEVKNILTILLNWIATLKIDCIAIERPNYSQLIKLIA